MSINSMTNVAVRSPRTAREMASAAAGTPEPQNPVTTALSMIVTYIPSEIIATYVAVMAVIHNPQRTVLTPELMVFGGFLMASPVVVWLLYAAKLRAADPSVALPVAPPRWPLWEMFAATLAYSVWAFALPDNPFTQGQMLGTELAGVGVLIVSVALGLLAPIFKRST